MEAHEVIRRPLHTEKSVEDIHLNNQYHFEVDKRASKHDIRSAIEALFPEVHVVSVRTLRRRGKRRRVRYREGRTHDMKKAIVKLRPQDSIDVGY